MTAAAPDVLADPVGVIVTLIRQAGQCLDEHELTGVVTAVAPGRNVQRRLARALAQRPGLLTDGRSPAPRVAGTLLIELRRAGAPGIAAPVCAECGKVLRTMQRRGQDWYCSVCGPARVRCAVCGKLRRLHSRDRAGRPRCHSCPPEYGPDPMQILVEVIASVDPQIPAATVTAAVGQVTSRAGQRRHLAWALQDRPDLLTGAGAEAPVPAVLRLIDVLAGQSAGRIVRPACPRCGRLVTLSKILDGVRVCRNCLAKAHAQTCSRCGAHREPATRDERGQPLCPNCLITDPANQETCAGCGRRRPVSTRTPAGPLCPSCQPVTTITCSICGRDAPGGISKVTGQPWCTACRQRRAVCAGCGKLRLVRDGTLTSPLCATCARPGDAFWHACSGCGEPTATRKRRCARCTLRRRLAELLGDGTGQVSPKLQALHDHLAGHDRPETVLAWLNKTTAAIMGDLATGRRALTHAGLDELPDTKPVRHLRSMLVATGALPARDEHLARLERWIFATLAGHDPDRRQLLHRYAVWHMLRRLRQRNNGEHATATQTVVVQQHLRAAIRLLDHLATRDLDLSTARQGDLDAWLSGNQATGRREAGHFIRWARRHKLTSLEFHATRWDGPQRVIDTEARWAHARRLLHQDTIKVEDRVAGLLVLLYAQTAATIARLTLEHVHAGEGQVRLRLGREPVVLPGPLDALMLQLIASRRGHATLGEQGTSTWLFPGGRPAQPISAARLAERLRQHGLPPGPTRATALFGLASELPAALLARLLGIHIGVAVAWQRACGGDWASYAAEYSRRTLPRPGTNDLE